MTVATKPVAIQAGGETAAQFRRVFQALFGRPGIIRATDCAVTQNGTPNMSVNVAAGQVVVAGTESTSQGYYLVYNDAAVNLTVAAADSTNARIDLIVAKVQDQEYSGTVDAASIVVVTGTAAPTPVAPTAPSNSVILAQIAVAANATSITNAAITDKRTFVGVQTGATNVVVASGTDSKTFAVTFPTPYASAPDVQCTPLEAPGGGFAVVLTSVTATGFAGAVWVTGSTPGSPHTVTVRWHADPTGT